MPSPTRKLEYLPLDDVQGALQNPKQHHESGLAASLERFGFTEPPLLDERTGRLVVGHGRLDALRARRDRGEAPPDGVVVKAGAWLVPVQRGWSSADDSEAAAYLLASNQLTTAGGWSDELGPMLDDLAAAGVSLDGLGWSDAELADLMAESQQTPTPGDADAVPLPPAVPVTQTGDLWQLGDHLLLCGDCTNADTPARLGLEGGADLVLTDPPYCSGGFQESARAGGSVGTNATHKQVANDRLSTRGYMALVRSALGAVPAPYAYVFTDWRMWVYLFDVVESSGFGVRSMVVWDKGSPGMGQGWRAQHELVMWAAKKTPPFDNHKAKANIVAAPRTGNTLHTTQKPVELLTTLLDVAEFAAVVYDPFAGSGSTLMACVQAGRQARLVEMDAVYCDVICHRYQAFTGDKPTRDGVPHDFTAAD